MEAIWARSVNSAERLEIVNALKKTGWKVAGPNGAAALLGLSRSTLQSRMQRLGIRAPRTGA